ncbi:hypothetical protein U1Q18_004541, partial [Sarracenia purpurea var. burkii]
RVTGKKERPNMEFKGKRRRKKRRKRGSTIEGRGEAKRGVQGKEEEKEKKKERIED